MAEFCLDCWNKLNGTRYTEKDVWTEGDLCEGCGKRKPVIVMFRQRGIRGWLQQRWNDLEYYACCWRERHRD